MGLLDKVLDAVCIFDWITPTKALLSRQRMTDFSVPERFDVEVWNIVGQLATPQLAGGRFMFQVPDDAASGVARMLQAAGIPFATDKVVR